ncbi:hypothetical protein ACFXHA_19565 [Nocardia sp. NPDC059240]|uniref:hypothetical protein n=1 Tax=Nocardia sp. NPDC059240 TaxID=3346786 RepID=UPI0036D1F165
MSRTITVAALSLASVFGSTALASADVVSPAQPPWPIPPIAESGSAIGDTIACRINYRFWAETDPGRPGHLMIELQALGIDALAAGSADPDSCGQWMTVRWNSTDLNDIGTLQLDERQVYLQAGRTPGEPMTFDVDVTRFAAGSRAQVMLTLGSRTGSYVPFASWIEPPTVVGYQFTV